MYYAFDKDNNKLHGYTDPIYKDGYPTIENAMSNCGEGGHVEDEDGNTVWTWDDWTKEK